MRFRVKALRANDLVTLALEAVDAQDAERQARGQGLTVVSVKADGGFLGFSTSRRPRFPLTLFTQELISLLDAGLTMVESIETLAEKETGSAAGQLLGDLLQSLYQGRTLSWAISQFPQVFPVLYVATVRASEKTGDLKEALARYLGYHEQMEKVKRKVVSASIYPLLLIGVGALVTLFLLLYVVPRFASVYDDVGGDLPFLSKLLIDWGRLLENRAGVAFSAAVGGLAAIAWGLTRPALRRMILPRLWRTPGVGERLRLYELGRFYRTLGMLLRSGIPMVQALDMAGELLSPALRGGLAGAAHDIREGRSASDALEKHGLSTPVALRMLRVGERSGNMSQMVERIANFYEEEMARWVDWVTRLFEPILMAVIGILIGGIVILLYLPIFELASTIQ